MLNKWMDSWSFWARDTSLVWKLQSSDLLLFFGDFINCSPVAPLPLLFHSWMLLEFVLSDIDSRKEVLLKSSGMKIEDKGVASAAPSRTLSKKDDCWLSDWWARLLAEVATVRGNIVLPYSCLPWHLSKPGNGMVMTLLSHDTWWPVSENSCTSWQTANGYFLFPVPKNNLIYCEFTPFLCLNGSVTMKFGES